MTNKPQLRLGLFSVGLDAYWPQFAGLKERLTGYNATIAERLNERGATVVNLGLIDTAEKAVEAGHKFRQEDVDLLFLHVATYALSSTVLPVVRRAKIPVIILNLAPGEAIDYASFNALGDRGEMTGEWLAWCGTCPVPEIANVFKRCRIPFFQVTGMLSGDQTAWHAIAWE
jgi:L-arabinose isomerase